MVPKIRELNIHIAGLYVTQTKDEGLFLQLAMTLVTATSQGETLVIQCLPPGTDPVTQ